MPNIMTKRQEHHEYCHYPAHELNEWGRVGDVRRCEHGVIQIGYEVRGTIPPYWRDLHWFWNPVRYRRAKRALS